MMPTFVAWWQARTDREQRILMIGGIVLIAVIIYYFAWTPLSARVSKNRETIKQHVALLSWTQAQQETINRYRKAGFVPHSTQPIVLLSVIEQSLTESKLSRYITNTQSNGEKSVTLIFTGVPFDKLMAWTEQSWQQQNITISNLQVKPTQATGAVNAKLTVTHRLATKPQQDQATQ